MVIVGVGQGRSEHREDDRVDRGPSGLMLFGELQERELNANFAIISYELKENGLVFEDLERIYRQKKNTWSIYALTASHRLEAVSHQENLNRLSSLLMRSFITQSLNLAHRDGSLDNLDG